MREGKRKGESKKKKQTKQNMNEESYILKYRYFLICILCVYLRGFLQCADDLIVT